MTTIDTLLTRIWPMLKVMTLVDLDYQTISCRYPPYTVHR